MRRILAAAAVLVGTLTMTTTDTAEAARPRYLLIGASVPRTAEAALRQRLGPTLQLEAVWGRSWIHNDMQGGDTLWQSFWKNYKSLRAGDWLIVEHGHGGVDLYTNRGYLRQVVELLPDNVCLAVVQPHTYYGVETPEMQQWNRDMNAMQREVIAAQPCHVQVWWSAEIRTQTARATNLPAADRALGAPLLYDGRHPTAAGSDALARLIAWCVGIR